MTKENALETIKILVLALKHQAAEMDQNPELIQRWQEKAEQFKQGVKDFSKEDQKWFEREYRTWLRENFSEEIQKILLTFG